MANFGDSDSRPLFSRAPALSLKLGLLLLVSLCLMFVDQRSDQLDMIRGALDLVAEPVQYAAGMPAAIGSLGAYFQSRSELVDENQALRKQVLTLRAAAQRLDALESENYRIRALLKSSEKINQRVLIAGVLSASSGPYRHYIRLDKGRIDGVYLGQALIDAYGIVGQVTRVGLTTSTAILITDPNHGIPVEINRTGLRTIAQGSGDGSGLKLPYLPRNANIKPGDLLVSSGLGGRYPPGYPVGTVSRAQHEPGGYFLNVSAQPAAHLRRGGEVLLVWRNSTRSDEKGTTAAAAEKPRDSTTPGTDSHS